jgi:hypothetical protein
MPMLLLALNITAEAAAKRRKISAYIYIANVK